MKKTNGTLELIRTGLAAALLVTLMGCAAYVDGGGGYVEGGYVDTVVVPGPIFYGDFHDRGRDVHAYHDRGHESRGVAHPAHHDKR